MRCLVDLNHFPWPGRNSFPEPVARGDYVRISIPPPRRFDVTTHEMLFDSQVMPVDEFWCQYYYPTSQRCFAQFD